MTPRVVHRGDAGFREPLIWATPRIERLWALGPDPNDARIVAIVGTRRPTAYGLEIARTLARDLAGAGVTIASGLAIGIDAAAHAGALSVAGRTIAVLAGGVDVPMPPQNRRLYREILARGGSVISEQPPGAPSYKARYLERNRIIAALSDAVIVVQAGLRSGATSTANWATDFNTELFGVPGDVRADASAGVHEMLKTHGHLCTGAQDVLSVLDWEPAPSVADAAGAPEPAAILDAMRGGAATVDDLVARTGITVPAALRALGSLEIAGRIERSGARYTLR